jgi:hypothetical protein
MIKRTWEPDSEQGTIVLKFGDTFEIVCGCPTVFLYEIQPDGRKMLVDNYKDVPTAYAAMIGG